MKYALPVASSDESNRELFRDSLRDLPVGVEILSAICFSIFACFEAQNDRILSQTLKKTKAKLTNP